jgi:hypothetical protein
MPQDQQPDAVEKEPVDPVEKVEETPPVEADGDDDEGRTPSAYEVKLRKENEKRRKEAEALAEKLKKFEDAERKKTEDKKKEEGKYQELLAEREAELLTLRERAALADILEAEKRTDLLERLPKKLREKYESVDIELLREIVTDFAAEEKKAPGSPGVDNPSPRNPTPKGWWEMTSAEQAELIERDYPTAQKLMREAGQQNRKRFR